MPLSVPWKAITFIVFVKAKRGVAVHRGPRFSSLLLSSPTKKVKGAHLLFYRRVRRRRTARWSTTNEKQLLSFSLLLLPSLIRNSSNSQQQQLSLSLATHSACQRVLCLPFLSPHNNNAANIIKFTYPLVAIQYRQVPLATATATATSFISYMFLMWSTRLLISSMPSSKQISSSLLGKIVVICCNSIHLFLFFSPSLSLTFCISFLSCSAYTIIRFKVTTHSHFTHLTSVHHFLATIFSADSLLSHNSFSPSCKPI